MKKSVYSLVLMDDVIKAVDRQAYMLGTSRSNLINQILAQHLSCVTPEMRMREIFGQISQLISSSLQIQQQRSASLMTARTALEYKYRPTISYRVELERMPEEYLGTLKVSIRTQSPALSEMFRSFFEYRARFEAGLPGMELYSCQIGDGVFSRRLINPGSMDDDLTGEAIGLYIRQLDRTVKAFFASPKDFPEAAPAYEQECRELLQSSRI